MNKAIQKSAAELYPHTIVIGCGPVGMRFATELLAREPGSRITMYGDEIAQPYNRVQLSSLLAGEVSVDDIALTIPEDSQQFSFIPKKISRINVAEKLVESVDGQTNTYDRLVLATGARAHVPNIPGLDQRGVYTFRSLKDAEHLYTRTWRAQHIVVIGGGVLGVESARALLKNNTKVSLIQQGPRLMNKQLDDHAADLLQASLEAKGIRVVTNTGVRNITGDGRVSGVILRNRESIECDTVLFCSGITPNIELARLARLRVNRGVVVDDSLCTSDPSVYAIGECCEHDGQTYGVVKPGYEQAVILADNLATQKYGSEQSAYAGSLLNVSLKVVNTPVHSFGSVVDYKKTPFHRELVFNKNGLYRKLVCYRGRLIGGVSVGEWPESNRVLESFRQGRTFSFWQRLCFRISGELWPFSRSNEISVWPAESIVCQCRNISKGAVCNAIDSGATGVAAVTQATSAASVCGSCKPLIEVLLVSKSNVSIVREKEWAWSPQLLLSMTALLIALSVFFIPGVAVGESVKAPALLEGLWNDKFWKQVTGFTLLGLSLLGLLMSARKRIKSEKLGKFAYWRFVHTVLGLACAFVLMLHSGLHLGSNLNRWLMLNFLLVLILGALAGSVVALSHRLQPIHAQRTIKIWLWLHLLVTWPLPVLLGMHILTVYYF